MEVPLELWEAVLHIAALDHFDLLSFGRTCKRFHRASWSLRRGFILSIGTFSLRSILQHLKNFDLVSEIRWLRLLEPRFDVDVREALAAVPEFPNLRSLRLDFREQHFPATSFPHLFSLAPSLLSLEIDSSDRRIFFTHFAASIHLFSSLARLKAMAHHSQGCRALSSAMQNFPSNLLSLSFLPSSISDILRMPCTGLTQLQFGDDNFTSWPSSEDIAAVAQRLPYLQSLHMDLQVTDGKPFPVMQLSLFKQLTSLHMNYDDTDTSPLRSLSLLTGLRELNLNMSNLSMVDSLRFLSTLTQLVSLDLSETFFMSETDDLSWTPTSLTLLNILTDCQVFYPRIAHLTRLRVLHCGLEETYMDDSVEHLISDIARLSALTDLSVFLPDLSYLHCFTRLLHLDLRSLQISCSDTAALSTTISCQEVSFLTTFSLLTTLELSSALLSTSAVGAISSLTRLRILSFGSADENSVLLLSRLTRLQFLGFNSPQKYSGIPPSFKKVLEFAPQLSGGFVNHTAVNWRHVRQKMQKLRTTQKRKHSELSGAATEQN